MKEKITQERRKGCRLLLKFEPNNGNKTSSTNALAVVALRVWIENKIKIVTIHRMLHIDVNIMYIKSHKGGRRLVSVKQCFRGEGNSSGLVYKEFKVEVKGERNKSIIFVLHLFLSSRDHYMQVSPSFFHF